MIISTICSDNTRLNETSDPWQHNALIEEKQYWIQNILSRTEFEISLKYIIWKQNFNLTKRNILMVQPSSQPLSWNVHLNPLDHSLLNSRQSSHLKVVTDVKTQIITYRADTFVNAMKRGVIKNENNLGHSTA